MCHYLGGGLHGRQKRVKAQSESSKSVVNSVLISREMPVFPGFLEIIRVVQYKRNKEKAGRMAINSHIQLPNSILKYFRDESDSEKKVWYLDISSGSIMKAASNKIGTSKGYYSDFGENFWNRTVEDTLAKLNHKFYKTYMQKENAEIGSLPMSQDDKDIIKKYIKAAMVRSSLAYKTMKQNSFTAELFSEQENHDALSYFGMISTGEVDCILDKLDVAFLINQTDRDLVVPRNCYYEINKSSGINIIVPVFPKGAWLLFEKEKQPEWIGCIGAIANPEVIEVMNVCALQYECTFNQAFVASNSYFEIERLQFFQEEHQSDLFGVRE